MGIDIYHVASGGVVFVGIVGLIVWFARELPK
jgi:hypothetical protein